MPSNVSAVSDSKAFGQASAPDAYGKFNRNWTGNPNAADQKLKVWLDPNNTGIEFLDGSYLVPGGAYPCVFVSNGDE
ncbi:MAG: hypothetical protein ACKOW8_10945, partial [Flavobacteriales bacterium]